MSAGTGGNCACGAGRADERLMAMERAERVVEIFMVVSVLVTIWRNRLSQLMAG